MRKVHNYYGYQTKKDAALMPEMRSAYKTRMEESSWGIKP
jgi:hypothetical protein